MRERMGLISNLWALLSSYKLDGGSYVESILHLSSDTNPAVIAALLDQLANKRMLKKKFQNDTPYRFFMFVEIGLGVLFHYILLYYFPYLFYDKKEIIEEELSSN